MDNYNLDFISYDDLFSHVKETVDQYRFKINLKQFNQNLIDPIKLTFDSKVYKKSIEEVVQDEIIRQIDKSNNNRIGYFHQNIFKHIDGNWTVPESGYDLENIEDNLFVEMKNKHNTMNSSSSQKIYMKMQNTLLNNDNAICYLVEVIAKNSQNIPWRISIDKKPMKHKKIRRISIDKFYELVTGKETAFLKLCEHIPMVLEDVINLISKEAEEKAKKNNKKIDPISIKNTVNEELLELSPNILKSLYLLSFKQYEGFDALNIK